MLYFKKPKLITQRTD